MNRDEVMALSDEELRAKAAELVGWKCVPCAAECATNIAAWPWMKDGIRGLPPDYPHDIAAAWELVEFMQTRAANIIEVEQDADRTAWDARFHGVTTDICGNFRDLPCYAADGITAPLAITRAFVLAMTQDKP